MHIITGGTYNGKNFSCMFEANERYSDLSPNGCFYFQSGINNDNNDHPALLIFSVESNHMIYAEEIESYDYYENNIQKVIKKMSFLTEKSETITYAKKVEVNENMMNIPETENITYLSSSQLCDLTFGTKIRVVWHNSKHHPKDESFDGVIFGDKIGWTDGLIDEIRAIAECIYNDWCKAYII